MQLINARDNSTDDPINDLQREIALLEKEVQAAKSELETFELQIQEQLKDQISRIEELFALYKKHKSDKKAKRLEQKKRGKNYTEPKQPALFKRQKTVEPTDVSLEKQALKRLYKEAVVFVHPDKFQYAGNEEEIKRATSITAQLNGVYKRGDLEELLNLYQYIVSGQREERTDYIKEEIMNSKTRMTSLRRKKTSLTTDLEKLKSSYTYSVLKTYENPLVFIDDLREQFRERIIQLEKRTKVRGAK